MLFPVGFLSTSRQLQLLPVLLGILIRVECSTTQRPTPRRDAEYPPVEALAYLRPVGQVCMKETGVSSEAIKRFSDADIFEDDRALKCYMDCIFRRANFTDDQGELHMGKLLDRVPKDYEDIALRMGIKCTRPKGKDVCERAFWFHKCWKTSDPVHYYLV